MRSLYEIRSFPLPSVSSSRYSGVQSDDEGDEGDEGERHAFSSFETNPDCQRHCRFCWAQLDEGCDDYVAPCDCKGSMEFVHADCLARWVCTKSSGGPGRRKQPGQCDVCKKHLSGYDRFRPGYLVGVKNAAIRLLQLYIVSTTAIGGMETAVNSVMASIAASSKDAAMGVGDSGVDGDQSASASRAASNLVKFLTGVCVVRTIVFRRADDLFFVFKVFRRVARAAFLGLEASSVRLVVV